MLENTGEARQVKIKPKLSSSYEVKDKTAYRLLQKENLDMIY